MYTNDSKHLPSHRFLFGAVADGRITKCSRCGCTPERFAAVAWFVPNGQSRPTVGYAVCGRCEPILAGRYGAEAKDLALADIEKRIKTEMVAGSVA